MSNNNDLMMMEIEKNSQEIYNSPSQSNDQESILSDIEIQNDSVSLQNLDEINEQQEENLNVSKYEFEFDFSKNNRNVFTIVRNARCSELSKKILSQSSKNQQQNLLKINYNRKEKSLEELSKRFLVLFLDKEESIISLEKITEKLGVERRRIYDIINILESLRLVNRKGKNNYKWNGFKRIYETIKEYQSKNPYNMNFVIEEKCTNTAITESQKKEKSLEMLSIGFLKLFLNWKNTMSLEEAARKLSNVCIDDHKIKTKIRRLYDIANVFKSIGLIKKTVLSTKKPGFQWIGIKGINSFVESVKLEEPSEEQHCIFNSNLQNNDNIIPTTLQQNQQQKFNLFNLKLEDSNSSSILENNSPCPVNDNECHSPTFNNNKSPLKQNISSVFKNQQGIIKNLFQSLNQVNSNENNENENKFVNNNNNNENKFLNNMLLLKCFVDLLQGSNNNSQQQQQQQQQQQLKIQKSPLKSTTNALNQQNNSNSATSLYLSSQKENLIEKINITPIMKKTFTIIQPKSEHQCNTTPLKKRLQLLSSQRKKDILQDTTNLVKRKSQTIFQVNKSQIKKIRQFEDENIHNNIAQNLQNNA